MNRPHSPNRRIRCLNPSCRRPAMARGLCMGCYQSARRLIRLGHTTWDQLIAIGKALPPVAVRTHSGPRRDWIMAPVAISDGSVKADVDATPEILRRQSTSEQSTNQSSEPAAEFMDLPK